MPRQHDGSVIQCGSTSIATSTSTTQREPLIAFGATVMDMGSKLGDRSDRELLALVADEHRDALAELYRRHAPWLLVRLRHRCADDGLVAEALQDTFVGVWRGASGYSGSGEVAAWLWGIGIRRLVGLLRKRRPIPVERVDLADPVVSAEEAVLAGTEFGALPGAMSRLSPELRAVVQATVLDGLTTREAGHLLGIPAGTVKTRMMRAKSELRGALT
jgi:RNA polymerase sigma-70 factor (ECF subfamily)